MWIDLISVKKPLEKLLPGDRCKGRKRPLGSMRGASPHAVGLLSARGTLLGGPTVPPAQRPCRPTSCPGTPETSGSSRSAPAVVPRPRDVAAIAAAPAGVAAAVRRHRRHAGDRGACRSPCRWLPLLPFASRRCCGRCWLRFADGPWPGPERLRARLLAALLPALLSIASVRSVRHCDRAAAARDRAGRDPPGGASWRWRGWCCRCGSLRCMGSGEDALRANSVMFFCSMRRPISRSIAASSGRSSARPAIWLPAMLRPGRVADACTCSWTRGRSAVDDVRQLLDVEPAGRDVVLGATSTWTRCVLEALQRRGRRAWLSFPWIALGHHAVASELLREASAPSVWRTPAPAASCWLDQARQQVALALPLHPAGGDEIHT